MVCYGCLLDKLQKSRESRFTSNDTWTAGWYYRSAALEIRDIDDQVVETGRWSYTIYELDAAIDNARLMHGSVHIVLPVFKGTEQVDSGFSVEIFPRQMFRCGDLEVAWEEEDHEREDNHVN